MESQRHKRPIGAKADKPGAFWKAVSHGLGVVGSTGETERVDVPQSYLNISRALFMADAPALKRAAADTPPLLDDYPNRLTPAFSPLRDDRFRFFLPLMDVQKTRAAFGESAIVSRLWPPALRQRSLEWFAVQDTINHGLALEPLSSPMLCSERSLP